MGFGNLKISVKTTISVIILALFALFIAWLGTNSSAEVNRLNTNGLHADQKVGMIQNLIINVMGLGRIEFRIAAVQQATTDSVDAIRAITSIIGQINEVTGSIAAAVEEQSAATQEIARNVQEASGGVQEVRANISQVNQASVESGQAASQVNQAAAELSQQSETLMTEVTSFIDRVRYA